jgi:hypothetical protein
MEYYVSTAYGLSPTAFSNLIALLLGILMQGAGHSGTLWALTSSVMFTPMEQTPGTIFHSPHPYGIACQAAGKAFVDDTSLWLLQMGMLLTMAAALMQTSAQ